MGLPAVQSLWWMCIFGTPYTCRASAALLSFFFNEETVHRCVRIHEGGVRRRTQADTLSCGCLSEWSHSPIVLHLHAMSVCQLNSDCCGVHLTHTLLFS